MDILAIEGQLCVPALFLGWRSKARLRSETSLGRLMAAGHGRAIMRGEASPQVGVSERSEAHPPHHCPWAGKARLGSGRELDKAKPCHNGFAELLP